MILLKVALNTINQSNQIIADFTAFSILLDLPKSANFGKVLFLGFFSTLHRFYGLARLGGRISTITNKDHNITTGKMKKNHGF
jgi:hypothetical protein